MYKLIWFKTYTTVFLTALIGSYLGTWLVRWFAPYVGLIDHPNHRKVHTSPIALGGGIAIYFAYAFAVFMTRDYSRAQEMIVFGGLVVLVLGILDDITGGISANIKFVALIIMTLLLAKTGILIRLTGLLPLDLIITLLWIVGVTSAINAVDNMNGLASGITIISSIAYFIVAFQTAEFWMGTLAIALIGACLGFFPHNFPKARIFMGDAGSFVLGFTLATMGIMGEWSENHFIACVIPTIILAVPIFDISYVVISRHIKGVTHTIKEAITHCAKDHLSHRLVDWGFSPTKAVLIIFLIHSALILGAVLLRVSQSVLDSILHIIQTGMILTIIVILMTAKHQLKKPAETIAGKNNNEASTSDTE